MEGDASKRRSDAESDASVQRRDESDGGGVDWNVARETTAGDMDLLLEVLQAFQIETPQMVEQIQQALNTRDRELMQRAAHTAKNALYSIGAAETGHIALRLENLARQAAWLEAPALLEQLQSHLRRVEREVQRYVENHSHP